jgi:uncharacterized SAM-binding protein YcdF (DUF218 family)
VAALLVVLLGSAAVGAGSQLGVFLLVSDVPVPADATFLTYGVSIRRAALDQAITRYHRGDGPRILMSGLSSRDEQYYVVPHPTNLARQYLLDGGVSEPAIEVLPLVSSEYEEGQALRRALEARGWQRVVAYAADFRARRTMGTLKRATAPTGVEVRVVAVRDPEVRLERWWETRPGINTIYNEYPRLTYYWLRGWL